MKTNTSRQPKVSALMRAGAALCVFIWVTGTTLCLAERFCNCTGHAESRHDHDDVATQEHGHSHEAEHHHGDAETHEHATASHHHDDGAAQGDHGCKGKCGDEKRCCSSIKLLVASPTPIVLAKPVSQTALLISVLGVAQERALNAPSTAVTRQARSRDWVFTPEVCLGPALHSLAPPASA